MNANSAQCNGGQQALVITTDSYHNYIYLYHLFTGILVSLPVLQLLRTPSMYKALSVNTYTQFKHTLTQTRLMCLILNSS